MRSSERWLRAIATYNVHRCVGSDRAERPERVARVIGELKPDVIALQEVQGGHGAGADHISLLAEHTAMHAIHGPTLEDERGRYGNAVLTRLAVREIRRLDLSVPGFEPRGALDVQIDAGRPLRVLATHLGLARRERRIQVERLLASLKEKPYLPTVLLGDFNEWLPSRIVFRSLRSRLLPAPPRPTFPARPALLPLDRIWLSRHCRLVRFASHRSPLARIASDHLPLFACVELGGGGRRRP